MTIYKTLSLKAIQQQADFAIDKRKFTYTLPAQMQQIGTLDVYSIGRRHIMKLEALHVKFD